MKYGGRKRKKMNPITLRALLKKKKSSFRLWRRCQHILHINKLPSAFLDKGHLLGHAGNLCWGQDLCSARVPVGWVRLALFRGKTSRVGAGEVR